MQVWQQRLGGEDGNRVQDETHLMIDEEDSGDVAIRSVSMIASSLSRRVHDHEWQETAVDMVIVPAVCVTYCQEKYNGDRQRGRERTTARIYTGSSLRNGEPNFMTVWSCSWWPSADVDLFHWAKNTIIFYSLLPYIIHTVDTHRHTYKQTHTHTHTLTKYTRLGGATPPVH